MAPGLVDKRFFATPDRRRRINESENQFRSALERGRNADGAPAQLLQQVIQHVTRNIPAQKRLKMNVPVGVQGSTDKCGDYEEVVRYGDVEAVLPLSLKEYLGFVATVLPLNSVSFLSVNDLTSPPADWINFYLGVVQPVEPKLEAFVNKRWLRIQNLLTGPLPPFVFPSISGIEKQLEAQKCEGHVTCSGDLIRKEIASNAKDVRILQKKQKTADLIAAVKASKSSRENAHASLEELEATRQKLLKMISKCLKQLRENGRIISRSEHRLFEILKSGSVPPDFIETVDPLTINLFVNELSIFRLQKRRRRSPELVLNDFMN